MAKQPTTIHKKGVRHRIEKGVFIGAVKTINSKIDTALEVEEQHMQERIDKICQNIPNCVRKVVRKQLENLDHFVLEALRHDMKRSASFLLNGYKCEKGFDCDVDVWLG